MRKLRNEELGRLNVEEFQQANKVPIILVLDDIRSLNNIGSVFRTADAFLLEKICLCGITGKPPHREINKTALGATETVSWEYNENMLSVLDSLREKGYRIAAIEQADQSISLEKFDPGKEKWALVFGNEVHGVHEECVSQADAVIEIPQYGTKHSLNIAVSVGIVVWDLLVKKGVLA
jgi:tRNA G18 (ribose-2'-O)-methylase SpoU